VLYYFVSPDGDEIQVEDNVKGWYSKKSNPEMFTQRRQAIAEARRRLKARIAELKEIFKETK
jgi:hypothetical protein